MRSPREESTRGVSPPGGLHAFANRVIAGIGIAIGLLLPVAILWLSASALLVLFGGLLLGVLLRTLALWLAGEGRRMRVGAALTIVVAVLTAGGMAAAWAMAPQLSRQADELSRTLPNAIQSLLGRLEGYGWGRYLIEAFERMDLAALPAAELFDRAGRVFTSSLWAAAKFLFFLFVGLYLAAEPERYRRGLLFLVPVSRRERASEVLGAVEHALRWWLLGQVISMALLGVSTTLLLWLLDMPLALILGLFVAVMTFVPYAGPWIAGAPIVALVLAEDPGKAALLVVLYTGIQVAEGYFITPMIFRAVVELPPALTLGVQLVMGTLLGALGFVLATPLLVVILVLIQHV